MTRPTTTSNRRRVQVDPTFNTPDLAVVAPINVDVPGDKGQGFALLQQALGVAGQFNRQREADKKAFADKGKAQGTADAQFDRVDQKRMSAEEKYAEGVVEYSYLGQYMQARENVLQRASTELDQTATVDEKAAWLDAQMDKELGSLLDEPRFREVIGPKYEDFINQFAAQEITATLSENEKIAVDTEAATAQESLDSGTFVYGDTIDRLSKVVGRTKAIEHAVDIVAGHAEATGNRKILDQIPTSVMTEDGQTLAGPRNTPKYRDRLNLALDRIKKTEDEKIRLETGKTQLAQFIRYDEMIRKRERITLGTFASDGVIISDDDPSADMSVAQARSLIDQSNAAADAEKAKTDERAVQLQAYKTYGGFFNAIGQENGPKTDDEARKWFQWWAHDLLLGMTEGDAKATTPVFMVSPAGEGLLSTVVAMSAKEGISYEPLRLIMSEVSPSAPGLILQRLDAYKNMKAQNVAHLYIDDDAAALYEAAITEQQAGTENPKEIAEAIRRFGDADTKGYVSANAPKASLRGKNFAFDVQGRFWKGDADDVTNRGYMDGRLDALIRSGLARNMSPARAQEFAKQRFGEAHSFVAVGERIFALPRDQVRDPKAVSDALNWFSTEAAQAVAEKAGFNPSSATLGISFANGRQVNFYIVDDGGNPLSGFFTLDQAVRAYQKRNRSTARAEANGKSEKMQRLRKVMDEIPATYPGPLE